MNLIVIHIGLNTTKSGTNKPKTRTEHLTYCEQSMKHVSSKNCFQNKSYLGNNCFNMWIKTAIKELLGNIFILKEHTRVVKAHLYGCLKLSMPTVTLTMRWEATYIQSDSKCNSGISLWNGFSRSMQMR